MTPTRTPRHARNLLTALLGLLALAAIFVPAQASTGPYVAELAMRHVEPAPQHVVPAATLATAASHAAAGQAGLACPSPYVGMLPNCACPAGSIGSFPTGCSCPPGSYGSPGSCSPCPSPSMPSKDGGCTCPPNASNCCPTTTQDCCTNGQFPPNHCCGSTFNPTGDPANCCQLYHTVANCCDTSKPSFDPSTCLCVETGVCTRLAVRVEAAEPLQGRDVAATPLDLAAAPPPVPAAPTAPVAGHAAA